MTSRLALGAATVALLATTLTGPASTAAAASRAAAAADPLAGAPTVGQCSDMSRRELQRNSFTEAPVDCAGPNTAEVVAVPVLPDKVSYKRIGRITRIAMKACMPVIEDRLGTSTLRVRMTAYSLGFFLPTTSQRAAGARWVRCDLVRYGGGRLLPLPETLAVGTFPFSDTAARCLVGRKRFITACSERHTYRASSAVKVRAERFPSREGWLRLAARACPRRVSTPRSFWATWSSKAAWSTGDRAIVCYSRTRR